MQILHTADDGQEPQAGASPDVAATPPAGTTPDAAPAAADAPTLSPAEARALKNEAQNLRKRLREFEEAKAETERANLTEAERLKADHEQAQQRIAALEATNRAYLLRDAIEAAVSAPTLPAEAGAEPQPNPLHGISPKLAARLLDASALRYGEDGAPAPASLRSALAALAAEYPEIRPQAPPAPAVTPYPAQRPSGGGPPPIKPDPANSYITQRYTTLPPNVTKR